MMKRLGFGGVALGRQTERWRLDWIRLFLSCSFVLFFVLGSEGCQRRTTVGGQPQAKITEYINLSFQVKSLQDRDALLRLLTGEAKTRLAAWSDDQFRQAFLEGNRQFQKLVFQETKPISEAEVMVTYELIYLDKPKGSGTKVTQRKVASLVKVSQEWLIREVQNVKELVEYQNEMSLP